jgi:hypothetical protein
MKFFLIPLLFFFISSQEKSSLKGSYKLEYKNATYFKNGIIVFNDSIYSMDLSEDLNSNGTINYGKNQIYLEGGNVYPNIILSFSTKEIVKDTIIFQVHNKKSYVMNYLDVSVNSGKLIKIRN